MPSGFLFFISIKIFYSPLKFSISFGRDPSVPWAGEGVGFHVGVTVLGQRKKVWAKRILSAAHGSSVTHVASGAAT